MQQAEIGVVGLGVMGANLSLNIAEKGFAVAVYNRTFDRTQQFIANAGELASRLVPCRSYADLVKAIRPPRPVILLVKAGSPVDQVIADLRKELSRDDIILDCGNANFRDTIRRFAELEGSGLAFLGVGISGGEEGARHGPSIMAGGPRPSYDRVAPVLTAIAAQYHGDACCAWLGNDGAGHFVKTIHNGIEYADMQMIAEIYGLLRDGFKLKPKETGAIFGRWNGGRLNSYLIEITDTVLEADDPKTGQPMVDVILDRAGQKGTGRWAVIEAQKMGVPATGIEAAVAARSLSAAKQEREAAAKVFALQVNSNLGAFTETKAKELETALLAGKICAYAQGFAVMQAASQEFSWDLPLPRIAEIWRAGCIIRSQFLDAIASGLAGAGWAGNLLTVPEFSTLMEDSHAGLRRVVAQAAEAGLPAPALSAALAYFDGYRQARGTADLIQAQRDFFGAHGFERVDEPGEHHGPWGNPALRAASDRA